MIDWLPPAIRIAAPALTLIIGGCLLFCSSIFLRPVDNHSVDNRRSLLGFIAFAFLLLASFFHVVQQDSIGSNGWNAGLFRYDTISLAAERLTLIGGFVIILIGWSIGPPKHLAEYYGCLLLILAGIPW